jgi:hypothetical protein
MMTEDRQAVMEAVLNGKLDASYVTMEEIKELEEIVFELVAAKKSPFMTYEVMQ